MRNPTRSDSLIAVEDAAPGGAVPYRDAAIVVLPRSRTDTRATSKDAAVTTNEIESWAQHARAANGLGDLENAATAAFDRPSVLASYYADRLHRSFTLAEILLAVFQAAIDVARRAYVHYRQHRRTQAIYETLRELDDHTLRDLGFDRSEIRSVAAELTGEAERTRVRVLLSSYGLLK